MILEVEQAFAERQVIYQKTLDVKKETLEAVLADENNFSELISTDTEIIEIKEKSEKNEIFVKIDVNACVINTSFIHQFDKNLHVIDFVSGSLKDSKLTLSLSKTWGFDGTENAGTVVVANFLINDIPCVPDFLVGNDVIRFALDKGLIELENKAKDFENTNYLKQNLEKNELIVNQNSKETNLEKNWESRLQIVKN